MTDEVRGYLRRVAREAGELEGASEPDDGRPMTPHRFDLLRRRGQEVAATIGLGPALSESFVVGFVAGASRSR